MAVKEAEDAKHLIQCRGFRHIPLFTADGEWIWTKIALNLYVAGELRMWATEPTEMRWYCTRRDGSWIEYHQRQRGVRGWLSRETVAAVDSGR